MASILDSYVTTAPSVQNALDIFRGEWASSLPGEFVQFKAGTIPLFEDGRIHWALEQFGGCKGKRVLELGPLEGGHTYILDNAGADEIISIESNTRAYLKCLLVKEILRFERVRFLCGDFLPYLEGGSERFDIVIASGVLYHMREPVKLLSLLSQSTDNLFLWTHYWDESLNTNPHLAHKFPSSELGDFRGFKHRLHRQEYQASLDSAGFCGGSEEYSFWLERQAILDCLKYLGFKDLRIALEMPEHPHGPCFCVAALK